MSEKKFLPPQKGGQTFIFTLKNDFAATLTAPEVTQLEQ
jgi:hypothetical protein